METIERRSRIENAMGGKKREGKKLLIDHFLPSLPYIRTRRLSHQIDWRLGCFFSKKPTAASVWHSVPTCDDPINNPTLSSWRLGSKGRPALYANAGTWKAAISQESNLGENGGFFSFLKQLFLHDGAYQINSHARRCVLWCRAKVYVFIETRTV